MATGYINIFEDEDGRVYPSGIVHTSETAAKAAQKNEKLKGTVIDLIKISYDDAKSHRSGRP